MSSRTSGWPPPARSSGHARPSRDFPASLPTGLVRAAVATALITAPIARMPGLVAWERPPGTSDATVAALGKLSEALEVAEQARGLLYGFRRLCGTADLTRQEAVSLPRDAGMPRGSGGTLADLLRAPDPAPFPAVSRLTQVDRGNYRGGRRYRQARGPYHGGDSRAAGGGRPGMRPRPVRHRS
jgi:hypothetical protein